MTPPHAFGAKSELTIFLPSLEGGGAERMMVTLANALAARGVDVTLALASASGPYLRDVAAAVRLVDLRSGSAVGSLLPLALHLRRSRPDVLLAAMSHANVVAALAWRLAGVPTRLVLSERAHFSSVRSGNSTLRMAVTSRLMRLTYSWASNIIAVSAGVADDLIRQLSLAEQRVTVAYNPVVGPDLERLSQEPPNHPWLVNGGTPVVLGAGRLLPQKDFATLMRAFAIARQARPLKLLIYGEGPQRRELLNLAVDLGIVADVDLPGFAINPFAPMRAADLFVLSSRFEGLPGVLIQAMACGSRVVSTDCPSGPAEILENGRWGRLVPIGDAQAMAKAILDALDDPCPPDTRLRANAFSEAAAVDRYAVALGLGSPAA